MPRVLILVLFSSSVLSLVLCLDFMDVQEDRPMRRRAPGCKLGAKFYNLEEEWNPVMPPYGRMICVRCRCLPVMKKGRLARKGMLTCTDISDQCPPVNCEDPVLLTGRCCKTCRGQDTYDHRSRENEMRYLRDYRSEGLIFSDDAGVDISIFTSLLIGRDNVTSAAGSGRFELHKNSLYYTVEVDGVKSPTLLMILDNKNTILYEHDLTEDGPRREEYKICGVWRNVPSIFRNYLKTGLLRVFLATKESEKGEIGGVIETVKQAERSTFSALLRSKDSDVSGSGGLAILEIDGGGNKLTYTVLLKRKKRTEKETVTAKFFFKREIVQQTEFIMSSHDSQFQQTWNKLSARNGRRLSRRRLRLEIVTSSGLTLSGDVRVRPVCETLQGVLSGHDTENHQETNSAGSAVFRVDDRGFVHYKIRVVGLPNQLQSLSLRYPSSGRQSDSALVTNVAKNFVPDILGTSGWAVGVYEKPKAVEIHKLLTDQVYINVEVHGTRGAFLSGSVSSLHFNPHIDTWTDQAFLMTGAEVTADQPHGAAGHAWITLSSDCTLYYQIITSGLSSGDATSAAQQGIAELGEYVSDQEPVIEPIDDFIGHVVIGDADNIGDYMFDALNSGHAFVQISTKEYKTGEIRSNVTVPNACRKTRESGMMDDRKQEDKKSCSDNGHEYQEYAVWSPSRCETCTCRGGIKKCEAEVCPELECKHGMETPEDACCPICKKASSKPKNDDDDDDKSDSCFFNGDKKWHKKGSKWHPYLFPFGYSRCALCECKESGEGVDCHRITCEPLACPPSMAIKREMECCEVCPENWAEELAANPELQGDLGNAVSCKVGDSEVQDGAEWTPKVVDSVMGCVKCRCNGGKVDCQRQSCPKVDCPNGYLVRSPGVCCPTCATSGNNDIFSPLNDPEDTSDDAEPIMTSPDALKSSKGVRVENETEGRVRKDAKKAKKRALREKRKRQRAKERKQRRRERRRQKKLRKEQKRLNKQKQNGL